jgi:hypothetical protein
MSQSQQISKNSAGWSLISAAYFLAERTCTLFLNSLMNFQSRRWLAVGLVVVFLEAISLSFFIVEIIISLLLKPVLLKSHLFFELNL